PQLNSRLFPYPTLFRSPVHSPDELYEAVKQLDWEAYLTPEHTLAVDCNVRDSAITHSKYAALRVKDAICDQFIERRGRRPSVDVDRKSTTSELQSRGHL